jgi:hypothetical protein
MPHELPARTDMYVPLVVMVEGIVTVLWFEPLLVMDEGDSIHQE